MKAEKILHGTDLVEMAGEVVGQFQKKQSRERYLKIFTETLPSIPENLAQVCQRGKERFSQLMRWRAKPVRDRLHTEVSEILLQDWKKHSWQELVSSVKSVKRPHLPLREALNWVTDPMKAPGVCAVSGGILFLMGDGAVDLIGTGNFEMSLRKPLSWVLGTVIGAIYGGLRCERYLARSDNDNDEGEYVSISF